MRQLWIDTYSPCTVGGCILPKRIKDVFESVIETGHLPNFLFHGRSGIGKTTMARALARELDAEYLLINGSDSRNLGDLRTTVESFITTRPMAEYKSELKIVIYDEADGLTGLTQDALKSFIEKASTHCRFIFTTNHKTKIDAAIQSRLVEVNFDILESEREEHKGSYLTAVKGILENEGIKFEASSLNGVVDKYYPDLRQCLNILQSQIQGGDINPSTAMTIPVVKYNELISILKNRKYDKMRTWVQTTGTYLDKTEVIQYLFDHCDSYLMPASIPPLIRLLSDYTDKLTRSSVPLVTFTAMFGDIIVNCKFKD